MKHKRILRWLITITILSILMAVIPATPALAAVSFVLSPTQGKVGDRINYSGTGYTQTTTAYYFDIYMSDTQAAVNNQIDTTVTRYKKVVFGVFIDESGTFSGSFTLPATLDEGTAGLASPLTVTAGTSYYIYATTRYMETNPLIPSKVIAAVTTFTVTPGASLDAPQPASGAPGTTGVILTGANFPASTTLVIQFDGTAITPTGGNTQTSSGGSFASIITIPSTATAGAHTITVTAGSSTATATFTVSAPAALTLSPTTGAAGVQVAISGTNFPAGAITITFDGAAVAITGGSTQASGGVFASFMTIPSSATVGAHTISITVGTATVSKEFSVTAAATTTPPPTTTTPPPTTTTPPATTTPPPTSTGKGIINVVQNSQAIGATIGIGGSGFTPGATVSIKWDDKEVASTKVNTDSTFQVIFKVPASLHGDRKITVSDGTNIVMKTFTVESVAPKVPPPLKPMLGAKVKSPVLFDWQDVTDDSLPVTYRLQVATDKSFGASTLVLDKTGLDSSSYTLTEAEELKLAAKDTAYYWRVKAIDAASNESEWTGAGEFYVPGPFVFPKWALFGGIAVGALIVFLLGLWFGRRTAFYY